MRGVLLLCAALAAAAASPPPPPPPATPPLYHTTLEHIKAQILAKLGLSSRPTPVGAPPRDVVQRILEHAADAQPAPAHDAAMREVIAIAHKVMFPLKSQESIQRYFKRLTMHNMEQEN